MAHIHVYMAHIHGYACHMDHKFTSKCHVNCVITEFDMSHPVQFHSFICAQCHISLILPGLVLILHLVTTPPRFKE